MYSYIIEVGGNRVGWVDGINNEQRRFAMGEGRVCRSWVVYPGPHSLLSPALWPLAPADLLASSPCFWLPAGLLTWETLVREWE